MPHRLISTTAISPAQKGGYTLHTMLQEQFARIGNSRIREAASSSGFIHRLKPGCHRLLTGVTNYTATAEGIAYRDAR